MKHFILAMLVLVATGSGCKKENQENLSQSIIGQWEMRQIFGSQIANAPTKFSRGNGQIIEFTETEYRYIEGGKVKHTEAYQLGSATMTIDGNTFDRVIVAGKYNLKMYFKIDGKKLTISTGTQAADGSTVIYERL